MTFKLIGVKSIEKQLKAVGLQAAPKVLAKTLRVSFRPVLEAARSNVPVDSGALRSAIAIATAIDSGKKSGKSAAVAAGIIIKSSTAIMRQATMAAAAFGEAQTKRLPPSRRWHFVELGTASQAPRPFLRPALDSQAQTVFNSVASNLDKQIRKALRKK